MRTPSLHLSAIYTPYGCCSYWASASFATLPSYVASYMVSVRQTRGLPKASFRFHITMDNLAVDYVLTATSSHSGLAPVGVRPCWANKIAYFEKNKSEELVIGIEIDKNLLHIEPWLGETGILSTNEKGEITDLDKVTNLLEKYNIQDLPTTRLNSSHVSISYAVFCLKKKKNKHTKKLT